MRKDILLGFRNLAFFYNDIDSLDATYENISGNIQLIDVRTFREFEITGTLKGAYKIPLTTEDGMVLRDEFVSDVLKSGIDIEKPIHIICRSGVRSRKATKILRQNGFKNVINLNGGILKLYMDGYRNFVK